MRIYQNEINTMTEVDKALVMETYRIFNQATDKGFGAVQPNEPDFSFTGQIRKGNATFSAFKVHRMQNDMASLLLDAEGNLKPFSKWLQEVSPIADHQCRHWLETEYNTAVIRAHRAKDWRRFESEKRLLPNLRWLPTTSPNQDAVHRRFWEVELTLPIEHEFWKKHRPGDRWNCKCSWESTEAPATPAHLIPDYDAPQDAPEAGLDNNPGIDGRMFSDTHPYIKNAYKGAKKAVDNIVREILTEEKYE